MIKKESLNLINSFLFSCVVAFSSLDLIFILPIVLILYFEKEFLFEILKKVVLLNFFILVLVVFVYFQDKQEAITLLLRTNLILLFNITLFHKSKGYDLVRGLDALRFPAKLVSVFYFSITLISYLLTDLKKTKDTLLARGFTRNTSIFTYQTYGNIFGMIFVKAFKKSEDMRYSMQSRGFAGKIYFLNSGYIEFSQKLVFLSIMIILTKVIYELFR